MRKRTVTTLLFSTALLLLTLPNNVWAANDDDPQPSQETPKIQVTVREGKIIFSNAVQNPPIFLPDTVVPAALPQLLDGRMPAAIQSLVHSISKTHGIDPQLVAAVMKVESNYDRWARSPKGALGLMQLIPQTGERFGVRDFYDPAQNIEGGVRYLRFLSDKFGPANVDLMLAAYNAGENLVERLGKVPPIQETRDYVRKIRTLYTPSNRPAPEAPTPAAKPTAVAASEAAEPKPTIIYTSVDARGVVHFSNVGPPN
jgi:soluble lytic murein transglycosylase-like protein